MRILNLGVGIVRGSTGERDEYGFWHSYNINGRWR